MVSCGFANICGGVLNSSQCKQPVFLQAGAPLFIMPFSACGEGFGKGNSVALSSSVGVRDTPSGSRVFVTF